MARTASKKTQYQAAAEKAIRDQLKARKELVGKIGDAEEAYEKLARSGRGRLKSFSIPAQPNSPRLTTRRSTAAGR